MPSPPTFAKSAGSIDPRWLGLAAIGFFVAHGMYQFGHGRLENLLWACHQADLCIGVGLLLRSRTVSAMGLVMLGFGVPMWLVGLATGGDFYPTSILTHLGGAAVGLLGVRQLGGLQGDWWRAYLFIVALLVASHSLTPPAMNINLAFRTWSFATEWIPNLASHLAVLLLIWGTGLYVAEQFFQKLLLRRTEQHAASYL